MKCLGNLTDCSLYVDDFCICYRSKGMATIERQLQQNLNKIKIGQQAMALSFPNQKHSVYISVSCASNMMIRFYIYMDHLFQLLRNLISLAFYFNRKLSFIPHIKYLKAKCLKALNLIKVFSHTSWGADQTSLLKLYRSLVRSKLDYGCIIYGSARKSYLQMLDPIHNQGLRLALGTSPVASPYVEADEPSLYSRREKLFCNML